MGKDYARKRDSTQRQKVGTCVCLSRNWRSPRWLKKGVSSVERLQGPVTAGQIQRFGMYLKLGSRICDTILKAQSGCYVNSGLG